MLRYAGMLNQSTQECNSARQLDPKNFAFRSCALSFLEIGNTDRAMDFVHLDMGSEWAAWVTPYVYLAKGNVAEAREAAKNMGKASSYHRELMVACTQEQRPVDIDGIARKEELSVMKEADSEEWYRVGELMAHCEQKDAAIRLLRGAIKHNYCAYESLQTDPLLVQLRGTPEFSELQSAAKQCQHVLVARDQNSH